MEGNLTSGLGKKAGIYLIPYLSLADTSQDVPQKKKKSFLFMFFFQDSLNTNDLIQTLLYTEVTLMYFQLPTLTLDIVIVL